MPPAVKIYAWLIIAGGASVLAMALSTGVPDYSSNFLIYLVLAILASLVKLRLPGVGGANSLGFFFILTGLCYFTLTETLAAACISAIAGTLLTRENRATLVQTLFNVANLVIGAGVCHLLVSLLRSRGVEPHHPAVLAAAAFFYFVVNTGIVSGVLSILEGKQLADVCREWHFWSFPYYLVGAAFAAVMSSTYLADNSSMAFLGLALLALLSVSRRLQLSAATARPPGA